MGNDGFGCARSCTSPDHRLGGALEVQCGRMASILLTARASRGPTVTVLLIGEMSSTYRGLPSAAGVPSRSAAALADGELMRAGVLADLDAVFIDDVARTAAEASIKKASGVAVGDEADVVAVRLFRNGESPIAASARTEAFSEPPSGK